MASARGMTLEDLFRAKYSLNKEDDLFQLIESAITVAVLEKKAEFHKRKGRIAQILNSETAYDIVFSTTSEEDSDGDDDDGGELPQITTPVVAANAKPQSGFRENTKSEEMVRENNNKRINGIQEKQRARDKGSNHEKKGNGGIYERKLEASERKLEKRYQDLEKRRRKIQLLEIKDAPKVENIGRVAKKIRF